MLSNGRGDSDGVGVGLQTVFARKDAKEKYKADGNRDWGLGTGFKLTTPFIGTDPPSVSFDRQGKHLL